MCRAPESTNPLGSGTPTLPALKTDKGPKRAPIQIWASFGGPLPDFLEPAAQASLAEAGHDRCTSHTDMRLLLLAAPDAGFDSPLGSLGGRALRPCLLKDSRVGSPRHFGTSVVLSGMQRGQAPCWLCAHSGQPPDFQRLCRTLP